MIESHQETASWHSGCQDRSHQANRCRSLSSRQLACLKQIVGESVVVRMMKQAIVALAASEADILIHGETGTGKELVARAIHELSSRANKRFVPINCGSIPPELGENEFFGHAVGAYTGAFKSFPGAVASAEGGTLFLDEICSLSPRLQASLLRLFQEREYRPLGDSVPRTANVSIMSAMNSDPVLAVKEGRLRSDLYYRLSGLELRVPSLRERRGDVPLLAKHFLGLFGVQHGKPKLRASAEAVAMLSAYDWPGNVRELQNKILQAVVLAATDVIDARDIILPAPNSAPCDAPQISLREARRAAERDWVADLLVRHGGNMKLAAKAGNISRRGLYYLKDKHGLTGLCR